MGEITKEERIKEIESMKRLLSLDFLNTVMPGDTAIVEMEFSKPALCKTQGFLLYRRDGFTVVSVSLIDFVYSEVKPFINRNGFQVFVHSDAYSTGYLYYNSRKSIFGNEAHNCSAKTDEEVLLQLANWLIVNKKTK